MKSRPYHLSKKAIADLDGIWLYSAQTWTTEQADRYYELIFDEIKAICRNIHSGKSMDHIRTGYHASKVKSHLIFYRVTGDVVEIIRILHERMDIEQRLSE